jgi:hypothetical protein
MVLNAWGTLPAQTAKLRSGESSQCRKKLLGAAWVVGLTSGQVLCCLYAAGGSSIGACLPTRHQAISYQAERSDCSLVLPSKKQRIVPILKPVRSSLIQVVWALDLQRWALRAELCAENPQLRRRLRTAQRPSPFIGH